jgi:hypothetical protein
MEHDEAVRSEAAERYASQELSPAEREAFEEHFFDCQECADAVRAELAFAANLRAVLRESSAERQQSPAGTSYPVRPWKRLQAHPAMALSFAANFVMAAGLGYVLWTGAQKVAPPRLAAAYFAPGPAKGAETVHAIAAGETIYQVRFDILDQGNTSYRYEILDAAGRRESSASLKAPPSDNDSLNLQIPVENLPGGVHTLSVRGEPGGEIVSWSKFRISR